MKIKWIKYIFIALLPIIIIVIDLFGVFDYVRFVLLQLPQPIERGFSAILSPVKMISKTIIGVNDTIKENQALKEQVHDLQEKVVDLQNVKYENELLKKATGYNIAPEFQKVRCTMLSRDPEGVVDTIIISCGKNQGLKEDLPILIDNVIVAQTIFCSDATCTGLLLSSSKSKIDAKIAKDETIKGVVQGSFATGLYFDLVKQGSDIKQGDLVVTGGIKSTIPAGILIGTAGTIVSKDSDLYKKVVIDSPISIEEIRYVTVLKQ